MDPPPGALKAFKWLPNDHPSPLDLSNSSTRQRRGSEQSATGIAEMSWKSNYEKHFTGKLALVSLLDTAVEEQQTIIKQNKHTPHLPPCP